MDAVMQYLEKDFSTSLSKHCYEGIKSVLETRKIKYLEHFTRIENLSSILDLGIIPRLDLERLGISVIFNDGNRYDKRKDCNCVSVEVHNKRLFDNFRSKSNGNWCIISLDARLLYNQVNFFAEHNAASWGIASNITRRCNPSSFEGMFAPQFDVRQSQRTLRCFRANVPKNITTSNQAEILVNGRIAPKYIKKIWFQNSLDYVKYSFDDRCKKIELSF